MCITFQHFYNFSEYTCIIIIDWFKLKIIDYYPQYKMKWCYKNVDPSLCEKYMLSS